MKKYFIGALLVIITFFSGATLANAQESIPVELSYSLNQSEFTVEETGKVEVEPIFGVVPKGTFTEVKNDDIDFKEDGTFTVLKAGTFEFGPSFTISEESEKEIKEAFIKQNNIENGNVDDYTLAIQQQQAVLDIIVKEPTNKRDISYNFKVDTTKLKVGEKGKITVEPLYGVTPKGQFKPEKNDFIDLKEDGTFTALKAGNVELRPTFTISEESAKEIDAAYIAQLEKPEESITSFPIEDKQQSISLEIKEEEKEKVLLNFSFTATPDSLVTGATGKLSPNAVYGVTPKGNFKAEKNDFIDLKEDGTFTTLKVGKAELKPTFTLSEDSMKEIKEAYIKQEKKTDLTVDDIELIYPDTQQVVAINIVEKTAATTTPSDSSTPKPTGTNKDTLPQTSDKTSQTLVFLGVSTLVASLGAIIIKRKTI